MARNLKDWTTVYSPATDDYPTGSAKDASSSEATDGTPYTKEILNSLIGVQQAILRNANFDLEQDISHKPENVNESDILRALLKIIGRDAGSLVDGEKVERQNADNVLQSNINNEAQARINNDCPVGTIIAWCGTAYRYFSNWTFMYGQTLENAATNYPEFYEIVPSSWKSGNDVVIPNIDGRTLIFYQWWSDQIGQKVEEFLPNITGIANARAWTRGGGNWTEPFTDSCKGALKWEKVKLPVEYYEVAEYDDNRSDNIGLTFDASRCSSVYGMNKPSWWSWGDVAMRGIMVSAMIKIK